MNGIERDILLGRSFVPALFWSLQRSFRAGSKSARRDQHSNAKEAQAKKKH